MNTIRVTKEFHFETAHALHNYDGLCKNIHGHSYKLFVCLKGKPIKDTSNPKNGMLIDFKDIKKIVNHHIVDPFDHALVLNKEDKMNEIALNNYTKSIIFDEQPTCENLCIHFAKILKVAFKDKAELVYLKLYETETSYTEWLAEDQI